MPIDFTRVESERKCSYGTGYKEKKQFIGKRTDEEKQRVQKRIVQKRIIQKQPFRGCEVICIADTQPKHFRKTS